MNGADGTVNFDVNACEAAYNTLFKRCSILSSLGEKIWDIALTPEISNFGDQIINRSDSIYATGQALYKIRIKVGATIEDQTFAQHAESLLGDAPLGRIADPNWLNKSNVSLASFSNIPLYNGAPQASDVYEGDLGDCYFMAALAAIAYKHPELIQEMITDNHDGTFTVTFPDGKAVTVDDDFWVGNNGTPVGAGIKGSKWAAIIEKAFATRYGDYSTIVAGHLGGIHYLWRHNFFFPWQHSEEIEGGLERLEGTAHKVDPTRVTEGNREKIWGELTEAAEKNWPTVAGTHNNASGQIVGDHDYSVENAYIKDSKQWVVVRNPWGRDSDKNPNSDGLVELTLDDFIKNFDRIWRVKL